MKRTLIIAATTASLAGASLAQVQLIDTENGDCMIAGSGTVSLFDGSCADYESGVSDVDGAPAEAASPRGVDSSSSGSEFDQPEDISSTS